MQTVESKNDGVVTLALTGRLDASNASALEERVLALINSGERRIVFDLAQLDYISSAGLRVLLVAAKRLGAADGQLALAGLRDSVREVFEIAGFSSIFQILPDAQAANAALKQ